MDVIGAAVRRERCGVRAAVVERLDELDAEGWRQPAERDAHREVTRLAADLRSHVRRILRPERPGPDAVAIRPGTDGPVDLAGGHAEVVCADEHGFGHASSTFR